MFNLVATIALYCLATSADNPRRIRNCYKEVQYCVRQNQISPLGTERQYLDECIYKWEKK